MNWTKYLVFPAGLNIILDRPEKFGGKAEYKDYQSMERDYMNGNIHPLDLKNALAKSLDTLLEPIREFDKQNPAGLELIEEFSR